MTLANEPPILWHFRVSHYNDRPERYLVGDRFSIADLSAAAVMTAIVRPPQFPYPLPEPWPPALVELKQSVMDHPAFQWVLDTYARHRGTSQEIITRAPLSPKLRSVASAPGDAPSRGW